VKDERTFALSEERQCDARQGLEQNLLVPPFWRNCDRVAVVVESKSEVQGIADPGTTSFFFPGLGGDRWEPVSRGFFELPYELCIASPFDDVGDVDVGTPRGALPDPAELTSDVRRVDGEAVTTREAPVTSWRSGHARD
jgi:hypothetical protein